MVGRAPELAALERVCAAACRQGGQYVLVGGAAGVGKSTLLKAFGDEVAGREGIFAYGRYREGERTPYSALADALDELVRAMDSTPAAERARWRAECDRGLRPMAAVLGAIVPRLADIGGSAPAPAPDLRHLLWRAAARLVGIAASFRPVVLAVDDLQWADRDSLLLLVDLLAASLRNVVLAAEAPVGRGACGRQRGEHACVHLPRQNHGARDDGSQHGVGSVRGGLCHGDGERDRGRLHIK